MQFSRVKGFTLAELMVIITVVGLLLIISMPGFSHFSQTWKLHSETHKMASAMRTARSAAIKRNIDVIFQFDIAQRSYFYFEDNNSNGSRDSDEYQSATYVLPPGISLSNHTLGATTIIFGPRGNSTQSGTITIQNVLRRTRQIRLFGGTGNTSVN